MVEAVQLLSCILYLRSLCLNVFHFYFVQHSKSVGEEEIISIVVPDVNLSEAVAFVKVKNIKVSSKNLKILVKSIEAQGLKVQGEGPGDFCQILGGRVYR